MKKLIALILCCGVGFLISCQQQTTAEQTTVDDVVYMMTEASGGAEALAALTDQVISGEMTVHSSEGTMTLPMTMTAKRPNKIRWDMYGPEGSIAYSRCFDGKAGWGMEMGQRKDLTEAELQEIESTAATFLDGNLNYQDKGFVLALLGDEVIDEQNYTVLQITDKHGNVSKSYINTETHFTERESRNMANDAGEWEPMTIILKDFKRVDGITFPHHMTQYNATGEMVWEMIVKEFKYNTGVDDAYFIAEVVSEKTGLKLHSSMVIHEGQLERALKFAKESMEYTNKNFPERNLQVYREVVGEGGKIHWFADFKYQEEIDEYWQKVSTDTVYSEILATAEGIFEEPVIVIMQSVY